MLLLFLKASLYCMLFQEPLNEFFEMTATNNRLSQYDLEPQVLSFNKLKEDSLLLLFLLLLHRHKRLNRKDTALCFWLRYTFSAVGC